ncbi:acyltransferase-like protein [Herbihabitans rhizosphaerae]|uniref:Acyltransferase-like protein n=1 Tax=Herbihabitans rhizosphaerae TaxID=1872711 RepID=A0A4Q7KDV6_9PSEU|nr:acyltransferase family protein [Herbihabitans rhizosphaerae]RZS29799.1 acyltransferase-like protein [Herbihabitans rhizosphaerae]
MITLSAGVVSPEKTTDPYFVSNRNAYDSCTGGWLLRAAVTVTRSSRYTTPSVLNSLAAANFRGSGRPWAAPAAGRLPPARSATSSWFSARLALARGETSLPSLVMPTVRTRDPFVDAVRAFAIIGVVCGHWLVTAILPAPGGVAAGFNVDSPLRYLPGMLPLSWVLQTLGLFFFAGGFAAAVSRARAPGGLPWWLGKVRKLAVAVVVVLTGWAVACGLWAPFGLSWATVHGVLNQVSSPLWFLAVYVALLAFTGPMLRLHDALGLASALVPAAVAVAAEVAVAAGAPTAVGQVSVLAVWWAPWQLGIAMARGWRPSAVQAGALFVCGVTAFALLITVGGFPVSAVGGTGEPRSNIAPPSPAALALAVAQLGLVLLLAPALRRLAGRAFVGWVNERALPIFLMHQSALLAVALIGSAFGELPGLHGLPDDWGWVLARLAWYPALAGALWMLLAGLGRVLAAAPPGPAPA